jgi:hypothetical protein
MRFLLSLVITLSVVLTIMVAIPFALIATAFWAADGSWDFEGRGFKHWMLVQGSRLDRLGTIEPTGTVKYSISLGEGNFPGWNIATYESVAMPSRIIDVYAARCGGLKLKVTEKKSLSDANAGTSRTELTCEIKKYLDVEIVAERKKNGGTTRVFVKVWGSE